jgi:D-alanyl-lipoteichoic acid acyltransferase DltB (MBOAT superfamily)
MLFNSLEFALFFPLVTALYFALPHRGRWPMLLAASVWFYMAFVPVYILILGFTIVIDYFAGILIENAHGARRREWLIVSLAANIGVLAVFKYWNFFADNFNGLTGALQWHHSMPLLKILLPIGLSFHTFQAMSYTIEVYRGRQPAERHFGIYALYVMFYPQLVAGPIERPQNLLHQFREVHTFDADRAFTGLGRMLFGLFKKVVIADRLALAVTHVYSQPEQFGAVALLLATWLFAIQIYCDFSGYSDIALGAAHVMGFRLMENFDRPYFSTSIGEFWRRWHISLSTWFKDFVYVPLGGSRTDVWRHCRNLLIVFLISGLWHGAAWTFVIWGALHGVYLVASVLTTRLRARMVDRFRLGRLGLGLVVLRGLLTFNLVAFAWIFFRAKSWADAQLIVGRLAGGALYVVTHPASLVAEIGALLSQASSAMFAWGVALGALLLLIEIAQGSRPFVVALAARPMWLRWSVYYAMVIMILSVGVLGEQTFIYFQF